MVHYFITNKCKIHRNVDKEISCFTEFQVDLLKGSLFSLNFKDTDSNLSCIVTDIWWIFVELPLEEYGVNLNHFDCLNVQSNMLFKILQFVNFEGFNLIQSCFDTNTHRKIRYVLLLKFFQFMNLFETLEILFSEILNKCKYAQKLFRSSANVNFHFE